MKKYDRYKDSGIEWIGEIPCHWEIVPIKYSLLIPLTDGPHETPALVPDGIPFISAEAIKNDKIDFDKKRGFISVEEHERFSLKYKPQMGDVYMIKSGATTGNLARVQTNEEFNIWSPLAAFRPAPSKTITDFLFYYMKSSRFFSAIELGWNYGTQQNIGMNVLENLRMVRPTLQEQLTIANYLDRKTAEIDELIADKKRLLELYEEEKTAIINQAVTKGINPGVKMKDSGIEWLGEIPEHWEVKNLKTIARVQTGRTPKIQNSQLDYFENGEFNWFTPADFDKNNELLESKRKIIKEAINSNEVELFPEYSIYLVSIGATLGKVSYFRKCASANQQINIITFKNDYNPLFGYYFLVGNKEMITLEADYTTLPILNQSKTKTLIFAVPPQSEQQVTVLYIETECARIDLKKSRTEKLIDLLTEYRTALISEVVTGKIKVDE